MATIATPRRRAGAIECVPGAMLASRCTPTTRPASATSGDEPLAHVARSATAWERAWEATGACLARLATGPMDLDLPFHDATAELEVTLAWVERAVAAGRLPPRDLGPSLLPLHDRAEPPTGLAHRDLHDGQLLFGSGRPGILDADTLAYAEPALDLANLLVHLDLRVDQRLLSCEDRRRAADAGW